MKNERQIFIKEIIKNFSKKEKKIPSKFHYDLKGSKYFEKITKAKEYYITRIEKKILKIIAKKITITFKNYTSFVEFGSGSTEKITILLNKKVKYYIPLDISFDFIKESSKKLCKKFPNLKIIPTYCDYNKFIDLPNKITKIKIGFFLGSSIGNFYNGEEKIFLKNAKKTLGRNSYLFVGADLIKNKAILEKAYNDSGGFAARFNLNLIRRMNNEIKTKLKINDFKYISKLNMPKTTMQSFIISKKNQKFSINGKNFILKKNEKIQTETSKKFTFSSFKKLAKSSGWKINEYWSDEKKYYAVFLLAS
jgi:L-histidine Nalpha-methyltransferase